MKILQVSPKFHPFVASGSTRVAYNISKELVKRGHSVTVYTSNVRDKYNRTEPKVEESDGIKIYRFRSIGTIFTREMKIFVTPTIISSIRKELPSFDVIHLHEYRTFQNMIIHHFANKYGIPYVIQAHGSLPRIISKQGLKLIYDMLYGYKILRDASKVIALTKTEAQQYRNMNVPCEKIEIIPNGIDLSEYADLPPKGSFKRKFNIPEDKKMILYLGRIHRSKGIDLLIRAYAYLNKNVNYNNTILVIAGPNDGYLDKVKSLARFLGVSSSVLFTGFISKKDKLGALVDADVFVTPSFNGFPITFLEACATGTPIVTTTLGDVLEWVDGNVGYVTLPSYRDLAKAIYTIISDDKLQRKFSANCIKIVKKKFSIEKVVYNLEKVYEKIVED